MRHFWHNVISGLVVALAMTAPANAEYWRSCHAVLELRDGRDQARLAYDWSVSGSVGSYLVINDARRIARRAIVSCMRAHWDRRNAATAPAECLTRPGVRFRDYPFGALALTLQRDYCAAYPTLQHAEVSVVLLIYGDVGCVTGGDTGGSLDPATRVDLSRAHDIYCTALPREIKPLPRFERLDR